MRQTRLRALAHERENGCDESCAERRWIGRANVCMLESMDGLSGKIVVAARLHRRHSLPQARK
jgi:hypothetical protein